jgi:hypothetical protein
MNTVPYLQDPCSIEAGNEHLFIRGFCAFNKQNTRGKV